MPQPRRAAAIHRTTYDSSLTDADLAAVVTALTGRHPNDADLPTTPHVLRRNTSKDH